MKVKTILISHGKLQKGLHPTAELGHSVPEGNEFLLVLESFRSAYCCGVALLFLL